MSNGGPNLDIRGSSVARSGARLRVTIQVADLRRLARYRTTGDRDTHLVWLVQWFSPSKTDPHGGKNAFAYMESVRGHAPTFWVGEAARGNLLTGAPGFTYPGVKRVHGS